MMIKGKNTIQRVFPFSLHQRCKQPQDILSDPQDP